MGKRFSLSVKLCTRLTIVLSCALVFVLGLLYAQGPWVTDSADPGVRCVKLMYEFRTPTELMSKQERLQNILTEEEYARLTVDEEMRAINTYFKFGYAASRVDIVEYGPGYVLYRLANENINYYDLWVFLYEQDETGLLTNIQEYRVLAEQSNFSNEDLEAVE